MKLLLNTWQRTNLTGVIGSVRTNIGETRTGLALIDILKMSDKDKKAIGFDKDTKEPKIDEEHRFEIVIPEELEAFLKKTVREFDGWPVASNVVNLADQLGL